MKAKSRFWKNVCLKLCHLIGKFLFDSSKIIWNNNIKLMLKLKSKSKDYRRPDLTAFPAEISKLSLP